MARALALDQEQISIHAPVKGATSENSLSDTDHTISIHAPVKGATGLGHGLKPVEIISIHAPVKGATLSRQPVIGFDIDFNPRSREGSDAMAAIPPSSPVYFNPRSREGSDNKRHYPVPNARISIHAPVKGATA